MEIGPYLAMTAAEFAGALSLPEKTGWMACHFSPYSAGLSNLPVSLPAGSILILNDRIPVCGHDPIRIIEQLHRTIEAMDCAALLLDFQRQDVEELQSLAAHLANALPCPVAVTEWYANDLDGPVFLSPCPHHTHLKEHIAPWKHRELWLDLAVDAETITLTKDDRTVFPLPLGELPDGGYEDKELHCHYRTVTGEDFARFTLWRTKADLEGLAQEASELGIKNLIGLYQEWRQM